MGTPTYVNLGLTSLPESKDATVLADIYKLYNACNILANAIDIINHGGSGGSGTGGVYVLPSDVAFIDHIQTFTRGQSGQYVTLTSTSGSIAINLSLGNNFQHALTESTTLAAPSNISPGQAGIIEFTQNASSLKTLAFNSFWKFPSAAVPIITPTLSAVDVLSYVINSAGTAATCAMLGNVS